MQTRPLPWILLGILLLLLLALGGLLPVPGGSAEGGEGRAASGAAGDAPPAGKAAGPAGPSLLPAPSEAAAGRREARIEARLRVRFCGPIAPEEGRLYLIPLGPDFLAALESRLDFTGFTVLEESGGRVLEVEGPVLEEPLDLDPETGELFLWAAVPGAFAVSAFVPVERGRAEAVLELRPAPPLTVRVTDAADRPLAGLGVYGTSDADPDYVHRDARGRLLHSWWFAEERTDATGRAWIRSPHPEGMTLKTGYEGSWAPAMEFGCRAGGEVRFRLGPACSVAGRVTDPEGNPLPDAAVVAVGGRDGAIVGLAETLCDQEGRYELERVSSEYGVLHLVAMDDGREFAMVPLPDPQPGVRYEQDFVLRRTECHPVDLRTAQGWPVPGARLRFARGSRDWVPGHVTTDAEGRAEAEACLVPGEAYVVRPEVAGVALEPVPVAPAAASEPVRIVLPAMARVGEVLLRDSPGGAAAREASWTAEGGGARGTAKWPAAEPSPLLVPGPGLLEVRDEAGRLWSRRLVLAAGEAARLEIGAGSGLVPLRFRLPEGSDRFTLVLREASGEEGLRREGLPGGPGELSLAPGLWTLEAERNGTPWTSLGPFLLEPPGRDLGELAPAAPAFLLCRVRDAGGRPVAALRLRLEAAGRPPREAVTEEDGSARFEGLGPGRYVLEADPFQGRLLPLPALRQEIFLGPGETAERDLALPPPAAEGLEVLLLGDVPASALGFGWTSGTLASLHLPEARRFVLPRLPGRMGIGCAASLANGFLFLSAEAPAGGQAELDPAQATERILEIRTAEGLPWTEGAVALRLEGALLPLRACPDRDGRLRLRVHGAAPAELEFLAGGRRVHALPLAAALGAGELVLPSPAPGGGRVLDLRGRPLSGASVQDLETGETDWSGTAGELPVLPLRPGGRYRARKPGYLDREGEADALRRGLRLRRILRGLRFEAPPGEERIATLRFLPAFQQEPPVAALEAPRDARLGAWRADLPEGPWRLQLLDRNGALLLETDFRAEPSQASVYILPRP